MGYPNLPARDMIRRTMANLDVIDGLHRRRLSDPDRQQPDVYEVTQLVNSFLGAWAHPWEVWRRDLERISLDDARTDGWPIPSPDDRRDTEPRHFGELLSLTRNAMAHGNIEFLRDFEGSDDIGRVRLWNLKGGFRTWGITLTVAELRQFLDGFVALAENLPDPRPRAVRHAQDRPAVDRPRTLSISNDLYAALTAYARDQGSGDGPDALVETVVRNFLAARDHIEAPFRPFQITPIEHEGDVADISITHDQYFAGGTSGASG